MRSKVEEAREDVQNSDISAANKKTILLMDIRNANDGINKVSRVMYMRAWYNLASHLGKKSFKQATREEIDVFMYKLREGKFSSMKGPPSKGYMDLHTVSVKKLYKMLYPELEEAPENVRHLKVRRKDDGIRKLQKEDLLSPREIELMVHVTKKKMWKALIKVLYESGFRVSELLSMNIGSVSFKGKEAVIRINTSKTRIRSVLIISALPELMDWIQEHPKNNDPDAPLWITYMGTCMSRLNVVYIIKEAAKKAGIKKRIFPHLFRHSIITWRKRMGMVHEEMCMFAGWSRNSNMPQHYSHFNIDDMFDRQRRQSGVPVTNPEDDTPLKTFEICPVCEKTYPLGHVICESCRMPLDNKKRMELLREAQKQSELMEGMKKVEPILSDLLPYLRIMAENKESLKRFVENLDKSN